VVANVVLVKIPAGPDENIDTKISLVKSQAESRIALLQERSRSRWGTEEMRVKKTGAINQMRVNKMRTKKMARLKPMIKRDGGNASLAGGHASW
jgi:hypothetical protein